MRKIKRCPAKIGNPVKWRHLLRHWFTLYDKIKTVITFLLFDRFWQMTQICQIIFCEFFKKKFFTFFGYHLSDVITIGNDLEHLRHQWRHSSCPMGEMITNHFFRKVLSNAVILVYWLSRSVKKQKSYGILKMTEIAMTSYIRFLFITCLFLNRLL